MANDVHRKKLERAYLALHKKFKPRPYGTPSPEVTKQNRDDVLLLLNELLIKAPKDPDLLVLKGLEVNEEVIRPVLNFAWMALKMHGLHPER